MMPSLRYSPASRKNVVRETDPYVARKPMPSTTICPECHAIQEHHRWVMDERRAGMMLKKKEGVSLRRCPACRKTADGFPFGLVSLEGAYLAFHHDEILNLVRNEEKRAMGFNPMARIMYLRESGGRVEVATTDEKLAQRIGRELRKACHGTVEYKWSEDAKLLRVRWSRDN